MRCRQYSYYFKVRVVPFHRSWTVLQDGRKAHIVSLEDKQKKHRNHAWRMNEREMKRSMRGIARTNVGEKGASTAKHTMQMKHCSARVKFNICIPSNAGKRPLLGIGLPCVYKRPPGILLPSDHIQKLLSFQDCARLNQPLFNDRRKIND